MPFAAPQGTPCWVDLQTPDVSRAAAFYAGVLGWEVTPPDEAHGGYVMCFADGEPVCGVGPINGEAPTAWTVYLATADVAATVAEAQGAGAQVLFAPHPVGVFGTMAIIADPTGAVIGLWQAGEHTGFGSMGTPGAPCWFEVNTWKAEQDRDFYAGLFGLDPRKMPDMDYWTLHDSSDEGAPPRYGILQMTREWEGMSPHWMSYFTTPSADDAVAAVAVEGGEVRFGPFDTPFGRMAVCTDPFGAAFTLCQLPG